MSEGEYDYCAKCGYQIEDCVCEEDAKKTK